MLLDLQDIIDLLGGIGYLILIIVITIVLLTIPLQIGIKAVKGENTKLVPVFLTGLLLVIISSILSIAFGFLPIPAWIGTIVSLLINLLIIKIRHKTTYLGALGALILWIVVLFIIFVIVGLIFAGFWAILFALIS